MLSCWQEICPQTCRIVRGRFLSQRTEDYIKLCFGFWFTSSLNLTNRLVKKYVNYLISVLGLQSTLRRSNWVLASGSRRCTISKIIWRSQENTLRSYKSVSKLGTPVFVAGNGGCLFRGQSCHMKHGHLFVTYLTLLGQRTWDGFSMRKPTTVLCIDPLDPKHRSFGSQMIFFSFGGFMIPSCKKKDTLKGFGSPWLHTAS